MPEAIPKQTASNIKTSKLQQCLEAIWYNNAWGKQLLYPLELIYKALARADRYQKLKKTIQHPIPVIVVGNISVGGTGKTPLVVYLCELLKAAGYSPGIVTRGYGGKATAWPVLVRADSDPNEYGDEPVLMAQRSGVPVVAGPNRNDDIEYLLSQNIVDVIISDDGLQHYSLARDIEIVVIDQLRGFGNQRCLPAGPLREPVSRLDSVDFVVSHEPMALADYSMQLEAQLVCRLNFAIQQPLLSWKETKVHAVTGIGNPSRFFALLKAAGLDVTEHSFPDHYQFDTSDVLFGDDLPVIMTEKDAVKCRAFATDHHWYVPVGAVLSERFDQDIIEKLTAVTIGKNT